MIKDFYPPPDITTCPVPSAGGAVQNPANVAGCSFWIDAADADTVTLNSGHVSAILDKCGNYNLTQGTAAAQPLYDIASINGQNAMSFDGGDYLLSSTFSNVFGATGAYTVIAVVKRTAGAGVNDQIIVGFGDFGAVNGGYSLLYKPSATAVAQRAVLHAFIAYKDDSSTAAVTLESITATYDPVSTVGLYYVDNTVLAISNSGAGYLPPFSPVFVGGEGVAAYFNGWICEIMMWPRVISSGEREELHDYLTAKWGI